jgi:hypothetical protein
MRSDKEVQKKNSKNSNEIVREKVILAHPEREEIKRRSIMALLKYFVRDPIWSRFTQPILARIFLTLRIP